MALKKYRYFGLQYTQSLSINFIELIKLFLLEHLILKLLIVNKNGNCYFRNINLLTLLT